MQYVTTRELEERKYILLQPGNYPARTGRGFQHIYSRPNQAAVEQICQSLHASEFVALDFETKGADYSHPDFRIIGIGLAWDKGSCYIHWAELESAGEATQDYLIAALLSHRGILCHNLYFDGGVAFSQWGQHLQAAACTYSLTAHLANESPEQRWGLKDLMVNLLGWEESNESDLDEWLITHRYYKGNPRKDNSPEALIQSYREGVLRPDKGEMWRVPKHILGKYCVLDAEATYPLFTEVLRPVLDQFPGLIQQQEEFLHLVRQLIEQKCGGIDMDREGLEARKTEVEHGMRGFVEWIRRHPDVEYHVGDMERAMQNELLQKQPEKLKKDGTLSKNWEKWESKYQAACKGILPVYQFNINSDFHLRDLLYDRMGFEPKILTEKGLPGTSAKALQGMGEVGKLLIDYNYLQKEMGFLEGYLDMISERPTIHPSFRTPGTVTGRLSSKEPNLQQVPKSKAMMQLFKARPGTVWVDIDFAALESVVAAEFSQDPNMLALYGDGVPENDIHLFVASQVPGAMGEAVLKTGYTALNPPPGTVSKAKKEAKKWRTIAKTCVYAMQFGAGVKKLNETLEAENIFLPWEEVELIYNTYWDVFRKLKDYGKSLWYEWRRNKGYILNGLGRPMAVPHDYSKDLLSRFIQSTGHDILVKYIYILCAELERRSIPYRPVIIDWHDATTVEVPTEFCQQTVEVMEWSMAELNRQLGGAIQMRGKPTWGINLADVKEPEE